MKLHDVLSQADPPLALAPMQDVTDLPFLRLVHRYGGADLYVTEYFRVYPGSTPNRHILKSITQNPTNRPILAQMIGNDVTALVRTARELARHPVAGIDLNLGCPAPIVYRKCAGGGLLRDLPQVDRILGALREALEIPFTIKTRIGFEDASSFERLLEIFAKHSPDMVVVHARTVKARYESAVHYQYVRMAVERLRCPVLANGNVSSPGKAAEALALTGARGLMIGRAAIRNPWLFEQTRQFLQGRPVTLPTGRDVLGYVRSLHETARLENPRETSQVQRLKKFMNYLGLGVDPKGAFLHAIRRASTVPDFARITEEFLNHDRPMKLEPFDPGLPPYPSHSSSKGPS
jgi:tRNA-dihydrouridine synthase